jgi:very-short-patch-repair endonuclease
VLQRYRPDPGDDVEARGELDRNVSNDRRVDEELIGGGWSVFRVWEHDLKAHPDAVVEKLLAFVGPRSLHKAPRSLP